MKKRSKTILIILSFVTSVFISFVIGINLGFSGGYSLSTSISSSAEVMLTSSSLKNLREGKIDEAIALLEIKLDSNIIEHKVSKKTSFAFFFVPISHIFKFEDKKDLSLFKQAIAYRKQYPSTQKDEKIRNSVHSYLEEIETELTNQVN